jgi:hypothetical protein
MGIVIAIVSVLGVFGLLFGTIFWVLQQEKKRKVALRALADSLGLEFVESGHDARLSGLQTFQLFSTGSNQTVTNTILGQTDVASIAIFDHRYTVGTGKARKFYQQTVVAMQSSELKLPGFTLRPENLLDKVGAVVGLKDINFPEHAQFSKQFVLKGQDEGAIRKFFDTQLLDFFARQPGIYFECAPGIFVYCRAAKMQKVEEMRSFLESGYTVYRALLDRMSRA